MNSEDIVSAVNEVAVNGRCPICGAVESYKRTYQGYVGSLYEMLRNNKAIKLDSCILCVQKHIARAMEYYDELLTAQGSGTSDGTASVNVYANYMKFLGHMGAAIEESEDFTELNEAITKAERAFRYYGVGPDWVNIMELMKKYGGAVPKITEK